MSPWTALLESMHSALIDEINERLPNAKPELGLPIRRSRWEVPATAASKILVSQIDLAGISGFLAVALDAASTKKLGITPNDLWKALLKRAGTEFHRREIKPQISTPLETDDKARLPKGLGEGAREPSKVIWIPIGVGGGQIFLGLGQA